MSSPYYGKCNEETLWSGSQVMLCPLIRIASGKPVRMSEWYKLEISYSPLMYVLIFQSAHQTGSGSTDSGSACETTGKHTSRFSTVWHFSYSTSCRRVDPCRPSIILSAYRPCVILQFRLQQPAFSLFTLSLNAYVTSSAMPSRVHVSRISL